MPNLITLVPPAFVAKLPPKEQLPLEPKSRGKKKPFSSRKF